MIKRVHVILAVVTAVLFLVAAEYTAVYFSYEAVSGEVTSVRSGNGRDSAIINCSNGLQLTVNLSGSYAKNIGDKVNIRINPETPMEYMHAGNLISVYTCAFTAGGICALLARHTRGTEMRISATEQDNLQ